VVPYAGRVTDGDARDIYLVRHAFAGHADPAQWPDDSKRRLTKDGIREFRSMARGLRRLVPEVDVVLSSSYSRAWETARLLREEAGWPKPQDCPPLEADKPAAAALPVLREPTASSIVVVGHVPHLSRLASLLCAGSEDAAEIKLKKGAVALLRIGADVQPGSGELRWLLQPKVLRAIDGAR
jgi:phosphohistidine phosphatase